MDANRRMVTFGLAAAFALPSVAATAAPADPGPVLHTWYRLILELVRHTPTYSPPVASRAFAYLGITAFEVVAAGNPALRSLAGQVNGLSPLPAPAASGPQDRAVVMQAAMAAAAHAFFGNTGPTGQRAMTAMEGKLRAQAVAGVPADVVQRSEAQGQAIAAHILNWSLDDGGHVVENMGFPHSYTLQDGPEHWVPTSLVRQQQAPLLPQWGTNRPFAMPTADACPLPPPPDYSEDPGSPFYKEAREVYDVTRTLTDEQRLIARFWSDDPMLSPTPPGHWISIAWGIIERDALPVEVSAALMARLGVAIADSFIACWQSKFEYDLLRPVTYIRRVIDPAWTPMLITPPFPEYPSGHSTQSGAAATVLSAAFGTDFAFEDATHVDDGLPVRAYPDFWTAAQEAGISRLYGGIHFRAAIERGLDQGRCVGAHAAALMTGV